MLKTTPLSDQLELGEPAYFPTELNINMFRDSNSDKVKQIELSSERFSR